MFIVSRSKWRKITSSILSTLRMIAARSCGVLMSGTQLPVMTLTGSVSKDTTAGRAESSSARFFTVLNSSRCPSCAPSKNPSASTRFSSIAYTSKKLLTVDNAPFSACPSRRNAPSSP